MTHQFNKTQRRFMADRIRAIYNHESTPVPGDVENLLRSFERGEISSPELSAALRNLV